MDKDILQIEDRFKQICEIDQSVDFSKFPFNKDNLCQAKTTKEHSKNFGQVFTPIFVVDGMINMYKGLNPQTKTCDLCAGYGQYTIRLIRKLVNKYSDFNVQDWLMNIHWLTELQTESCSKIVYIFGPNVNIYAGDSLMLKYSKEDDKGILFFDDKNKEWYNNQVLNQLIKYKTVYDNLDLLTYIFNNQQNQQVLNTVLNKILKSKYKE